MIHDQPQSFYRFSFFNVSFDFRTNGKSISILQRYIQQYQIICICFYFFQSILLTGYRLRQKALSFQEIGQGPDNGLIIISFSFIYNIPCTKSYLTIPVYFKKRLYHKKRYDIV